MPSSRSASLSITRRLLSLRGMMQISRRCKPEFVECEPNQHADTLGDIALAGAGAIDPVADGAALLRATNEVVQVDFAGEGAVNE